MATLSATSLCGSGRYCFHCRFTSASVGPHSIQTPGYPGPSIRTGWEYVPRVRVFPVNVAVAWSQLRFHFASALGNVGSGFPTSVKALAPWVNTQAAIPAALAIKLRLEVMKHLPEFLMDGPMLIVDIRKSALRPV